MGIHQNRTTLLLLAIGLLAGGRAAMAIPAAPALLSPSNGATIVQPFTESWSVVTDPSGIVAYNWQISGTSDFASILSNGSTSGPTQATISGLLSGTYFFRVQAVNASITQGAWSSVHSLTVSGSGPGVLSSPVLQPTKAYSTFHPYELEVFNWSVVPGALKYTLYVSQDPAFSVIKTAKYDNLTNPTMSFAIANPEGNYFARAVAIDANGISSQPSNVISFSVFFNNPIGPPPTNLSPLAGGTLNLPIKISWTDVPNPQPNGYEFEVAEDPDFKNVEYDYPQLNENFFSITSLTAGQKYWHVRSVQGDSTPLLPALTAWSSPGTFTVSTAPPTPVSVTLANNPLYSGDTTGVSIQLTAAGPPVGNMTITSSNPAAFPAPTTIPMPGIPAVTGFTVQAGQVSTPTPVTLTVTGNSKSTSVQFTVYPTSLKLFDISPTSVVGGTSPGGYIMLNGEAPPGGAVISVSSSSPALSVPASVTASAGFYWAMLPITTNPVLVKTPATITATWQGNSIQTQITVLPPQQPASITLSPSTIVGGSATSYASVVLSSAPTGDETLPVTVSNPSIATGVPATVYFPGGATTGGFFISTAAVATTTPITISVTGGGKTASAVLTLNPAPQVAVSALTISPTIVTGGSAATGTVTLASAAPVGGAVVILSSSNTTAATVPQNVSVPAGATSATFAISTFAASTVATATITATGGSVSRSATLTVNPAPQTVILTLAASGRSGVNVVSSPAGMNVPTGTTGQGAFTVGTKLTLSVTDGRDAIWSGACSSGGSKTKTCAFTINGAATVNSNVQ